VNTRYQIKRVVEIFSKLYNNNNGLKANREFEDGSRNPRDWGIYPGIGRLRTGND